MLAKIGLPPKPSLRGASWVPDVTHCQGCNSQFTFINRKHHCRRCGGLFCNSCTSHMMVLRGQGDSPVRICDPCKKLEEAARFEMRNGRKRTIRGCSSHNYPYSTSTNTKEISDEPSEFGTVPLQDFGGNGVDYSELFISHEVFPTCDDAIKWAKQVAIGADFFLVVSSYKPQRDGRRNCYLRCDRRKEMRTRDMDTAIRKNTKRKGCGCRFLIKVVERLERDGWFVVTDSSNGQHNHMLTVYPEGHRQISGLSPGAKKIVSDMTEAQAKPRNILLAVKEKFPEDNPNQRHIYNCRDYMRRVKSEGRNSAQQFLHQPASKFQSVPEDEILNQLMESDSKHPSSSGHEAGSHTDSDQVEGSTSTISRKLQEDPEISHGKSDEALLAFKRQKELERLLVLLN